MTYYVLATQQGGAELMKDKCPTVTASAGMSGNNQPVVFIPERERESGCLRHRPSGVQLRSECPVRLSHHGRGEHSAESKRTECRGSSDYETNQRKVGALCAVDYKQVQSQMVEAGKLILVPVTR